MVYACGEHDPDGPAEAKAVEARFERTGHVLHLHFPGGVVVRTTPEHPFFERVRGWVPAGALAAGDAVRTADGWVGVEEAFDTGCYEPVYNLRVADHHTYFVGDADWAFAVWAHNTYEFLSGLKVVEEVKREPGAAGALGANGEGDILAEIRGHGRYGAVGDRPAVVRTLVYELWLDTTSRPPNFVPDLKDVLQDYFKLRCVNDAHKTEEKNISGFSGPRPTVPPASPYPTTNPTKWTAFIYSSTWTSPWSAAVNMPVRHGLSDSDALNRGFTTARASFPRGDVHGHHIVFKEGVQGTGPVVEQAKRDAAEARDILLYYGINPYWDKQNLVYAPNWGHRAESIAFIRDQLRVSFNDRVDKGTPTFGVVAILKVLAQRFIDKDLPGMANYQGNP